MNFEHPNRRHKMLPVGIEAKLADSRLHPKDSASPVIVKYFSPYSEWTWYAIEGEKQENGDWRLYGLVIGHEKELGYFLLSDLAGQTRMGGRLPVVERDCHFGEHTLKEFL